MSSIEKISALLEMMKANDIVELELEEGDFSVALRKQGAFVPAMAQMAAMPQMPAMMQPMMQAAPAAAPAASSPAPAAAANDPSLGQIKSPTVGTFYRAPTPEAAPFVREGDAVKKDTVVCIIEAMKIMNEIKAEANGTIEKILVESGEPVEYGQPLFLIRK